MAEPRSDRLDVHMAIAAHLATQGSVRWDEVRARFPDVPVATFWRWVREVRTKPSPERMQAARDLLTSTPGAGLARTSFLPAPISIGAVTAAGVEATKQINFLREFDELLGDARLLRSFSMTRDGSKVRIPKIFADAAKLRVQLLQMWLGAIPVLYSAERMEQFYKSIVDAVSRCEPEVGRQITAQLKSLTEHAGYVVEH